MKTTTEEDWCQDSTAYRNPFNGFTCSDHNSSVCTHWINVLTENELGDLIESCPKTCNALSECMNATDTEIFNSTSVVAAASYLDEYSGDTSSNSSSIAVLSFLGFISVLSAGFLVRRQLSKGSVKEFEDGESTPKDSNIGSEEVPRQTDRGLRIICIDMDNTMLPRSNCQSPTPRWIPELNLYGESDSRSEHSTKDCCDVSVAQSNISYGPDITAPSPASSVRGILSPSESIVPHLLGAMRSYEYESDFSTSSP